MPNPTLSDAGPSRLRRLTGHREARPPNRGVWAVPYLVVALASLGSRLEAQDTAQTATGEAPLGAQVGEPVPSGLEEVETARSRQCVGVLTRVQALTGGLEPLGEVAGRLRQLMEAIILEDRDIMDGLDRSDPLEAQVHSWFVADGRLAQSFVDTGNEDLQRQRTMAREGIKGRVQSELDAVQQEATTLVEGSGNLDEMAAECDGAVFIRSAVLEACEAEESPLCDKAAAATPDSALPFRFVDAASDLWGIEQIRPWTPPQPLQVGPDGSLGGARTVVLARRGNVSVSLAFSPLVQQRSELDDTIAAELGLLLDSLQVEFDHPEIVFAPSLAIRATLPRALGGEDSYMLHFGPPDTADVVWTGAAATGSALEELVVLGPRHIRALVAGAPLTFTAVAAGEGEAPAEAVFVISLTAAGQSQATGGLLGYMVQQLPEQLMQLFPIGSG